MHSTSNNGSPFSISSCVIEATAWKTRPCFPRLFQKTLCRLFHCLNLYLTVSWHSCAKYFCFILSHWGKNIFNWHDIIHLSISILPLLSHHLTIHPLKYSLRFSNLATGHKGLVHLSTQYLLCRYVRQLHSGHLVHWIWMISTRPK